MAYSTPDVLLTTEVVTKANYDKIRGSIVADAHAEFDLGGSKVIAIPFGGSDQDAVNAIEFVVPTADSGGFVYKVVVEVRTENASTTVTPKLFNVTDTTVAWTGAAGTSTSWGSAAEQISSAVTLAAGKRYRLQFAKSDDVFEAWGFGRIRRTAA